MIADELTFFARAADLAAAIGTHRVGDCIDRGAAETTAAPRLFLVALAKEAITAAGAGSLQIELASDATGSLATDGTASSHVRGPATATSTTPIPAGTVLLCCAVPPGAYERYIGLLVRVAGNALTAGKLTAFLTPDASDWKAYASGG